MIAVLGARGFIGAAVVRELKAMGRAVCGTVSPRSDCPTDDDEYFAIDLADNPERLGDWLRARGVRGVIHAAFPPRTLLATAIDEADVQAQAIDRAVIDACRRCSSLRAVVLVSSGAVYGDRRGSGPGAVTEDQALLPSGRYGEIKLAQERRWNDANLDLEVILARPFNITGPGEPTTLVAAAFVKRMKESPGAPLTVRNSESIRDFVDVRDVGAALACLVTQPAGAYNIASGIPTSVGDLARRLALIGRTADILAPDGRGGDSWSCGDSSKLFASTGWRRRYTLEDSLHAVWSEASAGESVAAPALRTVPRIAS